LFSILYIVDAMYFLIYFVVAINSTQLIKPRFCCLLQS